MERNQLSELVLRIPGYKESFLKMQTALALLHEAYKKEYPQATHKEILGYINKGKSFAVRVK